MIEMFFVCVHNIKLYNAIVDIFQFCLELVNYINIYKTPCVMSQ